MKKRIFSLLVILPFLFLVSCDQNVEEIEEVEILPESEITMENVDDYLYRDDVQYIDLRNFDSRFANGYIDTFESIPFFDYLDYRIFDRNDTYEFEPTQIKDEQYLLDTFDSDKAILLYADGCIRSGYLKDVLNYLGYERVFVLGAFYEYVGEHLIYGDDDFYIGNTFYTVYTNEETNTTWMMFGTFEMSRKITSIRFDIIDANGISYRSPNYDELIDYNVQLTILEDYIEFDLVTFNELYTSITNADTSNYDQIAGYTLGYPEEILLMLSWKYID